MEKAVKYLTPLLLKHCSQRRDCRFVSPALGTRVSVDFVADVLRSKRVVYLGEIHGVPGIVRFQECVLDLLVHEAKARRAKVVLIMEHFAGPRHQLLVDKFMSSEDGADAMSLETFFSDYSETGEEGHDLVPYSNLLRYARSNNDVVSLKAGFIPRSYAKRMVAEGEAEGLEAAMKDGYIDRTENFLPGSPDHYRFFESLISGRDLSLAPSDQFRRIFPAQVLKDAAMARVIVSALRASSSPDDKFLVICGAGHCEYRFGVPERVDVADCVAKERTCIISSRSVSRYEIDWNNDLDKKEASLSSESFEKVPSFTNQFPADILFFYDDDDDETVLPENCVDSSAVHGGAVNHANDVKSEIAEAYDRVSETAHLRGDAALAESILKYLDYSDEDIEIAGADAFNYQGVGNPHKHAAVTLGDHVLDLGSGLGVDSFIAAARSGQAGRVTGLDISKGEVMHATKRAAARGLDDRVVFLNADMEAVPLEDASVDVVISNGAFCLAPDKEKAFREVFRVLRPGGRFSIACTTLLRDLEPGVRWPVCMRVFMPLREAKPMLDRIGFVEVGIDDTNSLMVYELGEHATKQKERQNASEETPVTSSISSPSVTNDSVPSRKKIHVGSRDFEHLKEFDMNQLCARVILHGRKPSL